MLKLTAALISFGGGSIHRRLFTGEKRNMLGKHRTHLKVDVVVWSELKKSMTQFSNQYWS